jgi:hypothetical protein
MGQTYGGMIECKQITMQAAIDYFEAESFPTE